MNAQPTPDPADRDHAVPCQHIECVRRAMFDRRVDTFRRDGLCDAHGALKDAEEG